LDNIGVVLSSLGWDMRRRLTTAKTLGIDVLLSLMVRADEMID
jgi:hypothetical protein